MTVIKKKKKIKLIESIAKCYGVCGIDEDKCYLYYGGSGGGNGGVGRVLVWLITEIMAVVMNGA